MASGVAKVIERCESGMESENLDLSECQLMQLPDAIFFLMRNTALKGFDLSSNVISKIPSKLPLKFSVLTELNLSHNRLGNLPEEIKELKSLKKLNISHNSFLNVPFPVYSLCQLQSLEAKTNFIADVEVEMLSGHKNLETVDLRENPLSEQMHDCLSKIESISFLLTPIVTEEWEIIPET